MTGLNQKIEFALNQFENLDKIGSAALTELFTQADDATCRSSEYIKRFLCSLECDSGTVSIFNLIWLVDEFNRPRLLSALNYAFNQRGYLDVQLDVFSSHLKRFRKELKIRKSK